MRHTYNLRTFDFGDFKTTSKVERITAILVPSNIDINITIITYADEMTCRGSTFDGCQFTACRIHSAFFEDCTVQDTDFSNCRLCLCLFAYSNIAHTRFFDCQLCRHGGFAFLQLKNVLFRDCNMDAINIGNCTLDGCSFARMRVKNIHRLETSTITQGGATPEECERLRVQTYQSLGVSIQKHRPPRNKER